MSVSLYGSGQTVVQVANFQTGALATGTGTIPFDNTIPQITEGDQFMSLSFTPLSATNKLKIDVFWQGTNSSVSALGFFVALFQNGVSNSLACAGSSVANASLSTFSFTYYGTAGTTSAITFSVRAGGPGGTTTFNGQNSTQFGGGALASSITITEYSQN
jgi:hypothetical protein